MLIELLQYFLIKRYYKNYVSCGDGYIENKNKRTLFSYSFVVDTIKIQDDLYKRINFLCVICLGNFDAIFKILAHLSASIFTSKSNHCSQIGHEILLYNFHMYCMISFIYVREINEQIWVGIMSGVR